MEYISIIIYLLFLTFPVLLCFIFGRWTEKNHIKDILKREASLKDLAWRNTGKFETFENTNGVLVYGSVVVAQDAFKALLAKITFIFGGRVTAYEPLMERARREAILRMKTKAKSIGATEIVHIRMETSPVGMTKNNFSSCVEVFCFGTALKPQKILVS